MEEAPNYWGCYYYYYYYYYYLTFIPHVSVILTSHQGSLICNRERFLPRSTSQNQEISNCDVPSPSWYLYNTISSLQCRKNGEEKAKQVSEPKNQDAYY